LVLALDADAERGPQGEIFIVGRTNFPDGMKMWVEVPSGQKQAASDSNVIVRDGRFRTAGLWFGFPNPNYRDYMKKWPDGAALKWRQKPFSAGKYHIHFYARFETGWQSPQVVSLLGGEGGRQLQGRFLKAADPDVADSPKELDASIPVVFPPISPEAEAISLVKAAILIVPGRGRSATDIEANVISFMVPGFGIRVAKGWSAKAAGRNTYEVSFDFINGKAGEEQAIWSVDLASKSVKYLNLNAKLFSWTPNY
jgi:hypothetical protein